MLVQNLMAQCLYATGEMIHLLKISLGVKL